LEELVGLSHYPGISRLDQFLVVDDTWWAWPEQQPLLPVGCKSASFATEESLMFRLNCLKTARVIFLLCVLVCVLVPIVSAQTFTNIANFDGANGSSPVGILAQGIDGNFYGATSTGGTCVGGGCGTVFKVTPSGALTTVYNFCRQAGCPDGNEPFWGLTLATDGNFYGTTYDGGANLVGGVVFKVSSAGREAVLYSFCENETCTDGSTPEGGVIQGQNGNFYGTTRDGGDGPLCISNGYCGNVFKTTPSGTTATVYNFCSQPNCADGVLPTTPLVQGSDGNFYGTTGGGAGNYYGTIFKLTPGGKLTTLYTFTSTQSEPSGLIQGTDGNFYGTTYYGGTIGLGTVYKITPRGTFTVLYNFCSKFGCSDGAGPFGGVVEGSDGNFYGTTSEGGLNASGTLGGTIYSVTSQGVITMLYNFCSQPNCADGSNPSAPPLQGSDGNFYGMAAYGDDKDGTIYKLSTGLGPLVKFLPAGGKPGSEVGILGTNLKGATAVTFNGTAAQFSVRSATLIVANVPTGATTGTIKVALPSGTVSSVASFVVLP
jgi:uncharacterized repeat protein (TIGR03803 family)